MLSDMVRDFLSGGESSDVWLTCVASGKVVGFGYTVLEQLSEGAWNMLAIAVSPTEQAGGDIIIKHHDAELKERGQRILIADA